MEVSRLDELGAATSWRRASFDKEGIFVFRGLRPGDYDTRTSEDENPGPGVRVIAGQTTEVDIVVPRPPLLRGQVLAGDTPIAGARIQYEFPRSAAPEDWDVIADGGRALDTARSDTEGRFLLTIAGAGSITVWASMSGGGASATVPLTVAQDQEATVVLRMGAGRLQGRVVEAIGGAPVHGAKVGAGNSFVAVDADGRFDLSHLQPGEYTLRAEAPGHLPAASAPLMLAGDETVSDLLLELVRAASLIVTVLGPDGFPVDGALTVVAWPVDGAVLRPWKDLRTQAGSVTIDSLPAGNYWVGLPGSAALQFAPNTSMDDRVDNRVPVTLVPGQTHEVTLHVAEGAAR